MVRPVEIVLRFILLCLCIRLTDANQYMLNGDRTDACFQPSQKATAECLQELIETYYSKYFTTYCPQFPQILADLRCTGCPWDRLDPNKINPDIAADYKDNGRETELFHEPGENCSLSKYVREFGTYNGVHKFAIRWAFLATIPILFSTGVIVRYTSDPTGLTRPSLLGWKVPEWMFIGAVWLTFDIGIIMLSISLEYYRYCDSITSNLAMAITQFSSYGVLIYYSLCRCRQLCFPIIENNQDPPLESTTEAFEKVCSCNSSNKGQPTYDSIKSWYSFVSYNEGMAWREYIRSKKLFGLCIVYGSSAVVLCIHLAEICRIFSIKYYIVEGYTCSLSSVQMSARAIAIAKLILEPLVHIVYSLGASTKSKVVHRIRYAVLALIAGSCITILFLMGSKSVYRPNSVSYLFWRVPLEDAVSEIVEVSHALTEPLRLGSFYTEQ